MSERLPAKAKARGLPALAQHLEPERLYSQYSTAITGMCLWAVDRKFLNRSAAGREATRQQLAICPTTTTLSRVIAELDEALEQPPDRMVTQASVAVMFDSIVRGPQNPETYLEALSFDLVDLGFPPAVVAGACQTLRRESTFCPSIAEVIEACRKKQNAYRSTARLAHRMFDLRIEIEDALEAANLAATVERTKLTEPEAELWD